MTAIASDRCSRGILNTLVAGYVALLPYQFETKNGVNFAPADCLMVAVLLLAIGNLRFHNLAWSGWHAGIFGIFAISSLVAAVRFGKLERYELLNKDAGLLLPFLTYAAITSVVAGWSDIRRILRVFGISVGLQNAVSVGGFFLAYFFGVSNPFVRYGGLRLSGMLLDPNAYGGLLVSALAVCEAGCQGPSPLFSKQVLWFFRLTLAMGILFTFSRSAWIALALALLVFTVLRTAAAVRLVLCALLALPLFLLVMGNRFIPIFEEMASRPQQVQGRFDLIHSALQAFARHPLLGGGIGSFRLAEHEIAHNTAMWFLADFGILGLAVLAGFIGWFFARAWLCYRLAGAVHKPLALALLMAHTAMFGLAMGIEAFYQRQWWVVLALIASSYRLVVPPFAAPAPTGAAILSDRPC